MSESPSRTEIVAAIKRVVDHAERTNKLSGRYKWHRRLVLRIDSTRETAERRLLPQHLSGDEVLDKSVEMFVAWSTAQSATEGSMERAFMLGRAQELMEVVLKDV